MSKLKTWNWWMIAFFVLLAIFEFTRETAVIQGDAQAEPHTLAPFLHIDGFTSAQGRWERIDDGGDLMPQATTIECHENLGLCVEANVGMSGNLVFAPGVTFYEATFTPDAITFQNEIPTCVTYETRIDLDMQKVFSVRRRKPESELAKDPVAQTGLCKSVLVERMELQLAKSQPALNDPLEGHFVPIYRLLFGIFE